MATEGYIKIYRKMIDWGWYKDGNTFRVFMHLLLKANFADGEFLGTVIKRGQTATSLQHIANDLGMSRSTVFRCINKLESTHEVKHFANAKYSVFTLINYDLYQSVETQVTHQAEQRRYTKRNTPDTQYKNNKNNKEEKEVNHAPASEDDEFKNRTF